MNTFLWDGSAATPVHTASQKPSSASSKQSNDCGFSANAQDGFQYKDAEDGESLTTPNAELKAYQAPGSARLMRIPHYKGSAKIIRPSCAPVMSSGVDVVITVAVDGERREPCHTAGSCRTAGSDTLPKVGLCNEGYFLS